jgi:hypothetical protein
MDFGYDPERGLVLPTPKGERRKAGPNPWSAPPLDPIWTKKLERIADRIGAPLRWYFMGGDQACSGTPARCWSIQQKMPRGWQTVFIAYDEDARWEGNAFPFKQIDDLVLREFCESSLRIQYNTGDEDEDLRLHNAKLDAENVAVKERNDKRRTELVANVIAGGDRKRFARLLRHEDMHAGPGIRFQEYFTGADLKPDGGGE